MWRECAYAKTVSGNLTVTDENYFSHWFMHNIVEL